MNDTGSRLRAQGSWVSRMLCLLALGMLQAAGAAGQAAAAKPAAPARQTTTDLSGYWLGSYFVGLQNIETAKGVIVDPPDGKIPYLPDVRAKATDIRANRMADEPELHCFRSRWTTGGFWLWA